jgi:N-methylhydantoinase A
MGGTSTDVALLQDGVARLAREAAICRYPINAPMLDVHTVAVGGGLIVFADSRGLLKVGQRSAGADPGSARYDRGNDEPTVTDAKYRVTQVEPDVSLGRSRGRVPGSPEAGIDNA